MNLQLFGNGGTREQELRNAMLQSLTETTNQLASTLYTHTWKTRTTPDGNQIISLRASQAKRAAGFSPWEKTPQASDGDGGVMEVREGSAGKYKLRDFAALANWEQDGWRTPTHQSDNSLRGNGQDPEKRAAQGHTINLTDQVRLASWPTPNAGPQNDTDGRWEERRAETKERVQNGNGFGMTLGMASTLASWPTPQANNAERGGSEQRATNPERGGSEQRATNPERSNDLHDFALLASWPTPNAMEGGQTSRSGERKDEMLMGGMVKPSPEGPARLTASGVMLTGSDAGMDGGGQLNPALPRWLQALPPEWDASAVTAMPSTRKSPKAS